MLRHHIDRLRWLLAAALLLGGSSGVQAGLIIEQRSNGLPGKTTEDTARQILKVGAGSIRLEGGEGSRVVIVRLDKEVYWELDPKLRLYTELPFERLRERRAKAEAEREEARLLALERYAADPEKLDEFLRQKALRRDGKQILVHDHIPERVGPYATTHHRLSLNGKVYLHLWTTDDIEEYEPPPELFLFYERCGLLPERITDELRTIEGFPVKILADVDYYSSGGTLGAEVQNVMAWPEDPAEFEVPEGYTLVERFPDPAQTRAATCPVCGEEKEKLPHRAPGSRLFVCSRGCQREFARDPRRYLPK